MLSLPFSSRSQAATDIYVTPWYPLGLFYDPPWIPKTMDAYVPYIKPCSICVHSIGTLLCTLNQFCTTHNT